MRFIGERTRVLKSIYETPLFSWAESHRKRSLTTGGHYIAKQFAMSPSRANLTAELAGVGRSEVL